MAALAVFAACCGKEAPAKARVEAGDEARKAFEAARRKGLPEQGVLLLVSVNEQTLRVIRAGRLVATYPVSTSRYGVGAAAGSNRTPLGLHRVAERIGDGEPAGRVFEGRERTSLVLPPGEWKQENTVDRVMTRILWLDGLVPGLNKGKRVDSHDRFIYIHGTNQEQLLGRPASHGCIRMGNRPVCELFDMLRNVEAWCSIVHEVSEAAPRG